MEEINIKIPDELKELKYADKINWQLIVGKMLKEKFEELNKIKEIVGRSKLTEEESQELSDEVNLALAKKYEKLLGK